MQRTLSIIVTVFLIGCHFAPAQESSISDISAKISEYVKPYADAGHLSGTLLVAQGKEVIYEVSFGKADRKNNRSFQSDTPVCIASVSKPMTVILASHLIENGVISLKDPISKWLKDFPNGDNIQVQHLLFHRAGIPHRLTEPDEENVPRTPADMVELAKKAELDFEPGSRNSYSSGGYSVLVRILELASGRTYEELLDKHILGPLQLENTFHPGPGVDVSQVAKSYSWTAEGQQASPEKDYSFLVGAGSLFSTPRDLFAVSRALIDGKFGEQVKRQLYSIRGDKLFWNGITNNNRAYLDFDSKTGVTTVLVSNQMTGANDLIRQNMPKILAGESVSPGNVPQPDLVKLPATLLESYSGRYRIGGSPMPVQARYKKTWPA